MANAGTAHTDSANKDRADSDRANPHVQSGYDQLEMTTYQLF